MVRYYNVKQISSFIYTFMGGIYGKLENMYRRKPPLLSKIKFFDSFTYVHIGVHSFSDSAVFLEQIVKDIWFCLQLYSNLIKSFPIMISIRKIFSTYLKRTGLPKRLSIIVAVKKL